MTESIEVTVPPQGRELMDLLEIRLSDPRDLAFTIAHRLAMAVSPDDLFAENGTNGWEDREGESFQVRRVWWLPSSFGEGIGFFAVVEAVAVETGELTVLTTGSTNVVIQLAKALQMGWLEQPVKLKKPPQASSAGYYPHRLVKA